MAEDEKKPRKNQKILDSIMASIGGSDIERRVGDIKNALNLWNLDFESLAETVIQYVDRPEDHVAVGSDQIIPVANFPEMTKEQLIAVKDYTFDGKGGSYQLINDFFRKRRDSIPDSAVAVDEKLLEMFDSYGGLRQDIRVYRGVPKEYAAKAKNEGEYIDFGYSSCSTGLATPIEYSKDCEILVIDLPKGYTAISIEVESSKPWEREVLLPRGTSLTFLKREEVNGFMFTYLKGEL